MWYSTAILSYKRKFDWVQGSKMTTLTIALQDSLDRQSSVTEELLKRAIYQYLDEAQVIESTTAEDALVGLFDLGDPLLSEKSEEILHALFAKEIK